MRIVRSNALVISLAILLAAPNAAKSQAQAPAPAASQASTQDALKPEELDQLVATIALYPDTLLAEVLMASTYPLEVVEASRWIDSNKSLKGDKLKSEAEKQGWDQSVSSLTATPSVLNMMSTNLKWTQKLGDAVLAQQPDVMDAVQRLRARAQAQKTLKTTNEQKVSTRTEQSKQVIVIEPAEPNTIYVPYYNPTLVYGLWPYPTYPPYYYRPGPGYYAGAAIATGIAFGVGLAVGAWATGGRYWGGGVNWGGNNINVNRQVNINNINVNNNWRHNPEHRQGVRYNNANVAQQFNRTNNISGKAQDRMDFRGRDGQQVLKPGQDRPGGDRPGADRPGGDRGQGNLGKGGAGQKKDVANRGGQQKNAAKQGGGDRKPSAGNRGGRDAAFSNVKGGGKSAVAQSQRGHASINRGGGGRPSAARGGGGRAGGGGGRGGGRRR